MKIEYNDLVSVVWGFIGIAFVLVFGFGGWILTGGR